MKYIVSKENKNVVKKIDDALLADYIATGAWRETSEEKFDTANKNFSSNLNAPKAKDEL